MARNRKVSIPAPVTEAPAPDPRTTFVMFGSFLLSNSATAALDDVASSSRAMDNATEAFNLKVAAFYAALGGNVSSLPRSNGRGGKQSPEYTALVSRWLDGYLSAEERNNEKAKEKGTQAWRRFLDRLYAMADAKVAVTEDSTPEALAAEAAAAGKQARKQARKARASSDPVDKTLAQVGECVKRIRADAEKQGGERAFKGHNELLAAFERVATLLAAH